MLPFYMCLGIATGFFSSDFLTNFVYLLLYFYTYQNETHYVCIVCMYVSMYVCMCACARTCVCVCVGGWVKS